jgi:predicted  nucleic acid-binding Zn-ribbon protein
VQLIAAIDSSAKQQAEAKVAMTLVPSRRKDIEDLTRRLDQFLDRGVPLSHELYDLRTDVKQSAEENRRLKLGRFVLSDMRQG